LPHPEVFGLNALMCLSESRRHAREINGEIVLLEDQDRSLWDNTLIAQGNEFLVESRRLGMPGYYALQAMIAAEHANVKLSGETNWIRIVDLYDQLDEVMPSPVVKLNRAVALAMSGEIEKGLQHITALIASGQLKGYGLAHAALGDLFRRLGDVTQAVSEYKVALSLAQMSPEKRFLQKRISDLESGLF